MSPTVVNVTDDTAKPLGAAVTIEVPLGLPALPIPAENPPTAAAIALGERLFNDPKLSSDETIACASCHQPQAYFVDGAVVAKGVGGKTGKRNTPTVLNAAYYAEQFWDGRAPTLEKQVDGPLANPLEMNMQHEVGVTKLNANPSYQAAFAEVFGPGAITLRKVEQAVASYERTLLSGNSPFDQFQFGGRKTALSAAAQRGLAVFRDRQRGNCATCHTIEQQHALFTDGKYHNLGVGLNAEGELTDEGRFAVTGVPTDKGAFRTPSLRNVAKTAPYMHDGSLKTLKDVIDFYLGGGSSNPQLDAEIKPLTLTAQERADLLAFLESLTGTVPPAMRRSERESTK